jgi:hypothetical protein
MRATRWPVSLAAVALLMTLGPVPAAAGGGLSAQSEEALQPRAVLDSDSEYYGWIEIDIVQTWSVPSPAAGLLENDFHLFIRRFRSQFSLSGAAGSSFPDFTVISHKAIQFYLMARQRVKPDPDLPDMCLGSIVTFRGEGRMEGYVGSATAAGGEWMIPGLRFAPSPATPDITFLGGDCEPGRGALQQSSWSALQSVMSMPGDVMWFFREGIRWPRSSTSPDYIEGSCDAPLYGQSGGRVQCQWAVHRVSGAGAVAPPRRR